MPRIYTTRPLADRLWEKVDCSDPDACWVWPGCVNRSGHGFIRHEGKNLYTHRVAYELAVGPVPDGLKVLHDCPTGDNPRCINPAHLWTGTSADNSADMVAKGRSARGLHHGMAKLSDEDVAAIHRRFPYTGCAPLAAEYDVHPATIWKIVRGTRRNSQEQL